MPVNVDTIIFNNNNIQFWRKNGRETGSEIWLA